MLDIYETIVEFCRNLYVYYPFFYAEKLKIVQNQDLKNHWCILNIPYKPTHSLLKTYIQDKKDSLSFTIIDAPYFLQYVNQRYFSIIYLIFFADYN